MRHWPLSLAVLLLAALAWWFSPWPTRELESPYTLGTVERGRLSATVNASGTLAARLTVQVGSQVSGQVESLEVDFNSPVRRGQVIARLDPQTFQSRVAQAEADVRAAESSAEVARGNLAVREAGLAKAGIALDEARRDVERKRVLVGQGFLSPAELERVEALLASNLEQHRLAEAEARVGRAQVENALALLAQRQAALRQARLELEHTVIRAPVDGVVVSRNVDVGQTVAASLQAPVLFAIAQDLTRMEVQIAVDEADIARVRLGQKVNFSVDAHPGGRFSGEVSQIRLAPQVSNNVVTYAVIATVDNPELKLLPGMTANARIRTDERADALKVPNEALRFRPLDADGKPIRMDVGARVEGPGIPGRVWKPGSDGKPVPVALRLGVSDGRFTEVLAGALKEADAVILAQAEPGNKPARPFGRAF